MFELRDYQAQGIQSGIDYCRSSSDPVIYNYSVGSGKTIIIKEIAKYVISKGGQVLSLAHTIELIESAYKTFGSGCCVYSSGLGRKELDKKMIYAGEKSIVNVLHKLPKIDLLCIDECDRVNDAEPKSSYMKIIKHILRVNPKCRVLGFTGTAERMGTGAIYGSKRFFKKIISEVTAGQLLERGYLTKVITEDVNNKYNFEDKKIYTDKYLESVVKKDHRLTKHIIDDVIHKTKNRNKILIFASTVRHCDEINKYFSDGGEQSLILTSKLNQTERKSALNQFHYGDCKYLINKDILTVGYDFPEIDSIAILRPTESKRLIQQIIGRSMRLHESKKDALFLDYAGNLERHGTLEELFSGKKTKVKTKNKKDDDEIIQCPSCGSLNKPTARICKCGFFFVSKVCDICELEQDITIKYCKGCGHEIVDVNQPLYALSNNGEEIFRARVLNTSLSKYNKPGSIHICLRIDVVVSDKINKYPSIATFIPVHTGLFKHWVKSHLKEGFNLDSYDSLEAVLRYQGDFNLDKVLTYQKVKGKKYFKIIED